MPISIFLIVASYYCIHPCIVSYIFYHWDLYINIYIYLYIYNINHHWPLLDIYYPEDWAGRGGGEVDNVIFTHVVVYH